MRFLAQTSVLNIPRHSTYSIPIGFEYFIRSGRFILLFANWHWTPVYVSVFGSCPLFGNYIFSFSRRPKKWERKMKMNCTRENNANKSPHGEWGQPTKNDYIEWTWVFSFVFSTAPRWHERGFFFRLNDFPPFAWNRRTLFFLPTFDWHPLSGTSCN